MGVELVLKEGVRIEDLPGYKTKLSGSDHDTYTRHLVGNLEFHFGRHAYIEMSESIPPDLVGHVVISMRETFEWYAEREPGKYTHKSASAVVEITYTGGKHNRQQLNIKLTSETMEDAREIIELIRFGNIRPTKSLAAPQSGKSYRELLSTIAQQDHDIRSLRETIANKDSLIIGCTWINHLAIGIFGATAGIVLVMLLSRI